MLTLPVSTAALAGWPMLYGTVAMAVLWFGTKFLALWPADVEGARVLAGAAGRITSCLDARR